MANSFEVEIFGQAFSVDRVAFSIGSFSVYWYGILIAVGFLGALIYAYRRAPDFKIRLDPMVDVVLVGAIGAVVCARLYYVVMQWDEFSSAPSKIFDLRAGGLAIYGGVIGAFLFGGLMCRVKKIKVLAMFDLAGIGFLFGQAVGRWGNFINQEAFGTNTTMPWGMFSEGTYNELRASQSELAAMGVTVDPSLPVHPCFLYESIWCLLGFVLLHFYSKHRRFNGEIALALHSLLWAWPFLYRGAAHRFADDWAGARVSAARFALFCRRGDRAAGPAAQIPPSYQGGAGLPARLCVWRPAGGGALPA